MKVAAVLLFLFGTVRCQESTIPVGETGNDTLTVIRVVDDQGNYDVGYNENQLTGGASFHREKGYANGTREGSYGYTTRNGLIRIVTYVADQDGYRPQVLTNEPGVAAVNPSNVTITKEQEPDPAALAQVPTGYSQGSNYNNMVESPTGSDEQNLVRNYVVSSGSQSPVVPGPILYGSGSASVIFVSPYVAYQYMF